MVSLFKCGLKTVVKDTEFLKQKAFKINLKIKCNTTVLRNNFYDLSAIIKTELCAEYFHVIYILS
jgi:hypothetical protein